MFTFTVEDEDSRDGFREFLQSQPEINYLQNRRKYRLRARHQPGVAATASKIRVRDESADVLLNREALIELFGASSKRNPMLESAPLGSLMRMDGTREWYSQTLFHIMPTGLAKRCPDMPR